MPRINKPASNRGAGLQKAMGLASVVEGAATGNPAAIVGGVQSLKGESPSPSAVNISNSPAGIDRRLIREEIPIRDRIKQLQLAETVIPELPRDIQEDVAPAIFQAIALTAQEFKDQQGIS